jgi:hypothetical protein
VAPRPGAGYGRDVRSPALAAACAACLVLIAACGAKGPPPVLPEAPTRDSVREILVHNCGTCHRGELPEAKPAALAIFDLSHKEDWDRNLTAEHLVIAKKRLGATREENTHFARWADAQMPLRKQH